MKLRVGSRESKLAVIQAGIVIDAIKSWDPSIDVELVTMKTQGDRILDRNLDRIGGKGLFIKELELALLEDEVDITVHSLKDMPMEISPELPVVAMSEREDPRDALILPVGAQKVDLSKPIGSSSNRRILQLSRIYPDATFEPIRGNVQTRLDKLDSGDYSATVMAVAGLKRAGLEDRISRIFEPDEMLPAAGQGVLAVQARKGFDNSCLRGFMDNKATAEALCERSFVRALDGGCTSPVAAYARIKGDVIKLTGLNTDANRSPFTMEVEGPASEGEALGTELAEKMRR